MCYNVIIFSQFVVAPTRCIINAMDLKFPNTIMLLKVKYFEGFSNRSKDDEFVINSISGCNCNNYNLIITITHLTIASSEETKRFISNQRTTSIPWHLKCSREGYACQLPYHLVSVSIGILLIYTVYWIMHHCKLNKRKHFHCKFNFGNAIIICADIDMLTS